MTLQFQRWLNTDYQPYVYATIEASSDGTNWIPVWDNGTAEVADDAWTAGVVRHFCRGRQSARTFSSGGAITSHPRSRFPIPAGILMTSSSWALPRGRLAVAIPPTANVGAGTLAGTVAASPPPATDLVVSLDVQRSFCRHRSCSGDHSSGANQCAIRFDHRRRASRAGNGGSADSSRAPDYVAGSGIIQVLDSAAVALNLSLPDDGG